jgi:hypothetical protein
MYQYFGRIFYLHLQEYSGTRVFPKVNTFLSEYMASYAIGQEPRYHHENLDYLKLRDPATCMIRRSRSTMNVSIS